jgi:hypothetical protein
VGGVLSIPRAVRGAFLFPGPTLAHFLALSAWAPGVGSPDAPPGEVARAARILDLPPDEALAWRPGSGKPPAVIPRGLREDVARRLADALSTMLPLQDASAPSGLGWWLELLHLAVAELHLPLREALAVPVAQLYALAAAHAAANGAHFSAPAYEEQDVLATLPDETPAGSTAAGDGFPVADEGLDGPPDRNQDERGGHPQHEPVPPPEHDRRDKAQQGRENEKPSAERIDIHVRTISGS